MSGPEDFVSFDDYLGLNQGAGEAMSNQLMSEGDKLRDEARAATDARFAAAKGGSDAYAASGQRETKALTSYGDFMQKMKDPAARQAAMAKVFGSANRFDAALTGAAGAGRMAQGDADLRGAQHYAEEAGIRNEPRAGQYDAMRQQYDQQTKSYDAAMKARRDAQTAGRAKQQSADEDKFWGALLETGNQKGRGGQLNQRVADTNGFGGGKMWQPFGEEESTKKTWRESAQAMWAEMSPEDRKKRISMMRNPSTAKGWTATEGYGGWAPE